MTRQAGQGNRDRAGGFSGAMESPALSFVEAGLSALERALQAHHGELRNVQLATLSPDGAPGLRTVVLRGFERSPASAEMHTDARAAKARDIAGDGRVSLLAWSAEDRLQLRFDGIARLHRNDDLARGRWDGLSANARKAYGLRSQPGSPIADPTEQAHLPEAAQAEQFAVILVALDSVDVLRLEEGGGQTRARGRFDAAGLSAAWIGA